MKQGQAAILQYKGSYYRVAADPQRDRAYRQQAEQAYKSLVTALEKGYAVSRPGQSYSVAGEYLTGGDYSNLVVLFAEQGDQLQGALAPVRRHGKFDYAIILNAIPDFWAEKTEEEQRRMLPHLAFESVFVHEFIHYLDQLRREAPISPKERVKWKQRGQPGPGTEERQQAYFSNPEEFNAWFQAMAHSTEQSLRTLIPIPRVMENVWLRDFPTFREKFVSHVESYGWNVEYLDQKYRRKLDKRLYGLWEHLREEYLEG